MQKLLLAHMNCSQSGPSVTSVQTARKPCAPTALSAEMNLHRNIKCMLKKQINKQVNKSKITYNPLL
jgi:hypothetical protein